MDTSRFRFTDCQAARPDQCVLGVTPSNAIWDASNVITSNGDFVAVPWSQAGSTAVLKCGASGKLPSTIPVVRGQSGAIIETAFDPFDPQLLMTASEDGSIRGYKIPSDGLTETIEKADISLDGHSRKCGILTFHPSARGVLASAGADTLVNIWDVATSSVKMSIDEHTEYATGLDWNLDGSLLCSTARNKTVNVIDPRTQHISISSVAHQSARTQRCIWAKRQDKILTFGWDSTMRRQIKIWDPRNMTEASDVSVVDQSGSAMMPLFDEDLHLIYLGSRGEGGVKCFELTEKGIIPSFEYSSFDPLRGICAVPKERLDVKKCEIAHLYTLTAQSLSSVHLVAPRRNADSTFQADLFPPTFSAGPALLADQYFGGKNAQPKEISLEYLFNGTAAPAPPNPPASAPAARINTPQKTASQNQAAGGSSKQEVAQTRHVDPSANVAATTPSTKPEVATPKAAPATGVTRNESEVESLMTNYRAQKAAVAALREELAKKEAEMLFTLEQLEKALGV